MTAHDNEARRDDGGRQVAFMQPGPLHLFWTTGVFYCWLLMDEFDLVLIVPENYRQDSRFQKLCQIKAIRHVEYFPTDGYFTRHFRYRQSFDQLARDFRPTLVFLNNRSYLENQYLLRAARRNAPKARRYYFQNGRMALFWQDDFAARQAVRTERVVRWVPLCGRSQRLAAFVAQLIDRLHFILTFKLLPGLATGRFFRPPVDVYSGAVDHAAAASSSASAQDFVLAYLDNEAEVYRSHGFANVVKIRHPVSECGMQVLEFIYGGLAPADSILILPSYGYTSRMALTWDMAELIEHIAGRWCEAIEALLAKFNGYGLKMKLHPAAQHDPAWQEITSRMQRRYPQLEILPAAESAEWHIAQAKVVVGDVTTSLWWAGLFGNKLSISLDIFGYPGGDELRHYPALILYLNSLAFLCDKIPQPESPCTASQTGLRAVLH